MRPNSPDELVERALAAAIARKPRAAQQLNSQHIGLLGDLRGKQRPERLDLGRPPDPASRPLGRGLQLHHRFLSLDALHAALRDAGELDHLLQRVPGPAQHLNLVSLEHVDHPFPRHWIAWRAF